MSFLELFGLEGDKVNALGTVIKMAVYTRMTLLTLTALTQKLFPESVHSVLQSYEHNEMKLTWV